MRPKTVKLDPTANFVTQEERKQKKLDVNHLK